MKHQHIVIVGATSAIAEHCARIWVSKHTVKLTLIARNTKHLEDIAADLRVRNPKTTTNLISGDFFDPTAIAAQVSKILQEDPVDIVLIAQGSLPNQTEAEQNLTLCQDAFNINALSPILYAEAFAHHLAIANHGTIAVISSVAGDRGRKSNYIYGAAKACVNSYLDGLRHRFANTPVHIVCIRPGPTDTPMTTALKHQGLSVAPVELVAKQIVAGISTGQSILYTPAKWRLIMAIIRRIPVAIFHKLNI